MNHLREVHGPILFPAIKEEIDNNRPICVRVEWNEEGAHFLCITGYGHSPSGGEVLITDDPFHGGPSRLAYADMCTNYKGHGKWSHTLLVEAS